MKSHKNTIYYMVYVMIYNHLKINSVNLLYLIINKINVYIEENNNGDKYLTLGPTDESKEILRKYDKMWSKIKDLIRLITTNSDDYDVKYMKIKFDSNDDLALKKTLELPNMTIVVRSVLHEVNKYYPQVFLNESLYKL